MAARFTPTGVGTTPPLQTTSPPPPVHPHGCGDNTVSMFSWGLCPGSPPRVWGQRKAAVPQPVQPRFTPTGVGTTSPAPTPSSASAVHPHGCGDNGL